MSKGSATGPRWTRWPSGAAGILTFCLYVADAINKAKEFADNVGNIDRLRSENSELNRLNQSMPQEFKFVKESLAKAEQALETEKQNKIDALRELQGQLDKRQDESTTIDSQLPSKFN